MTPEQAAALRAPFPESAIGHLPKGGMMLRYVGHAATTDRLLAVDPGWTWEPAVHYPGTDVPLPGGDKGLWIKLTVAGVTRYGYGDGAGPNAVKEAIGDAIRNAAMRFGVALDLWSKEELSSPTVDPAIAAHRALAADVSKVDRGKVSRVSVPRDRAPSPTPDPFIVDPTGARWSVDPASKAQLGKIGALMAERGLTDHDLALAYVNDTLHPDPPITSRKDLTKAQASRLIDALAVADAEG